MHVRVVAAADPLQVRLDDAFLVVVIVLIDVPVDLEQRCEGSEDFLLGVFGDHELLASTVLRMTATLNMAGILQPVNQNGR